MPFLSLDKAGNQKKREYMSDGKKDAKIMTSRILVSAKIINFGTIHDANITS